MTKAGRLGWSEVLFKNKSCNTSADTHINASREYVVGSIKANRNADCWAYTLIIRVIGPGARSGPAPREFIETIHVFAGAGTCSGAAKRPLLEASKGYINA